jgi:hypothetical protein
VRAIERFDFSCAAKRKSRVERCDLVFAYRGGEDNRVENMVGLEKGKDNRRERATTRKERQKKEGCGRKERQKKERYGKEVLQREGWMSEIEKKVT